jgi:methylase of polypeptide subunit release factors
VESIRAALVDVGYDEVRIAERLGMSAVSVRERELPLYLRRLTRGDELDQLIKLFLLGERIRASELSTDLAELEEAGIVDRAGEDVTAPLRLTPWEGLLLAHDRDDPRALRPDYVNGVNPATMTLASLTVRQPVQTALDLGSGCGVQALLAARHAEEVVATDINPRAVWLVGINAALNGFANVEARQGNLFDPVVERRFDLIASNPPFVISPETEFVFRDSGLRRDELSRIVVQGASAALTEGGFATILCNWIVDDPANASVQVEEWVDGQGCDALLLLYEVIEPAFYAARWLEPHRTGDAEEYAQVVDRWLDYYDDERVARIGVGGIVLRRREGDNWLRTLQVAAGPSGNASDQILRVFAAAAERADAASLLDRRFELVEGHHIDQRLVYADGDYGAPETGVFLNEGIGLRGAVDPHAIHVLLELDGERTLGEVIATTAAETGIDLEDQAVATVERLYAGGFLHARD